METHNGWLKYWEDRVKKKESYYGKEGRNSNKIIEILRINSKDSVLDIGCAVGAHLTDIRNKTRADCYGIDISPIAIKLNKDKRIKLKVGEMEKVPFEENKFSKVFSLGVFEHTPDVLNPYLELNRVMKLRGLAYITVPNKIAFNHITKNIKMILGTWDLGYERSFTRKEIIDLTNKSGFKLESFWIEPHIQTANVFNWADNNLNKFNNKNFGFFINFVIKKIRNVK